MRFFSFRNFVVTCPVVFFLVVVVVVFLVMVRKRKKTWEGGPRGIIKYRTSIVVPKWY